MKKLIRFSFLLIGMALLHSCDFEFSTASIQDIKVCSQLEGQLCGESSATITPNAAEIFVSCELIFAPPETDIRFVWKYLEGEELTIDAITLNTGNEGSNLELHSSLNRPNNGWPAGKYAVDIMIGTDESSVKTVNFEVR